MAEPISRDRSIGVPLCSSLHTILGPLNAIGALPVRVAQIRSIGSSQLLAPRWDAGLNAVAFSADSTVCGEWKQGNNDFMASPNGSARVFDTPTGKEVPRLT